MTDYMCDQQTFTPAAAGTVTIAQNNSPVVNVSLENGTIASATINMPSTPLHGQRVNLYFNGIITALTLGNGTFINAITAATALLGCAFGYDSNDGKWHRCG